MRIQMCEPGGSPAETGPVSSAAVSTLSKIVAADRDLVRLAPVS
jgi:hypothetical protein